jgi:hypothetical protein
MVRVVTTLLIILVAVGCGSSTRCIRVAVPPRVDLHAVPLIGLVTFSSNTRNLDQLATQRFLQSIQSAQPGSRVIELGPEAQLLASMQSGSWNAATLAAVKKAHNVDVIVIGRLDVEQQKPNFQFSTILKQVSGNIDVNATLNCRILETTSGATTWADGAARIANLAHADVSARTGHIGARDTEAVYGQMVDDLVYQVTDAFRQHYVLRRVPKEQVLASAD